MSVSAIETTPLDYAIPRRQQLDRRQFSLKTVANSLLRPRRTSSRREADKDRAILDIHGWPAMISAIALILFSITDASFTLLLILRGGEEINPFMNYFLQQGVYEFVGVKMLFTALSTVAFIACWNYRIFSFIKAQNFLFASIAIYTLLVMYEIVLLNRAYPNLLS